MSETNLSSLVEKTRKLKLLYVEDSKDAREIVLEFLELFFDDISVAVDGVDAWSKYTLGTFDVILTDINMPNLNGLELSKKIREVDDKVAILVLSAYDNKEYFLDSIKYGIDAYLLKPFETEQFITSMLKVVKKIDNQKKLEAYSSKLQDMLSETRKKYKHTDVDEFNTKLPNYLTFQEDLISGKFNYMLLLEMSQFITMKEEYGAEFVSHVIIRTAHILEKLIHKNAKLYKIEAYKFVILFKNVNLMDIHFYCEQIGLFFDNKNIKVDDSELQISFNIGIDKIRQDISQTLINCECALDLAKESQKKHYEIYDEAISVFKNEEATDRLRLTRELIRKKKIQPYFQAIKNIVSKKIDIYEAFARGIMNDKVIPPVDFIESSQKLGLFSDITQMMIDKSFKIFSDERETFSINLTEIDLMSGYLGKFLQEKVKEYGLYPSRVIFEIPEEVILDKKSKKIAKRLKELRLIGFKIAVDNFSVEHSNLSRLFEVELDYIKIDGIFIKTLKTDEHNKIITKAVVSLAKTLGIKTIAKFVEDRETYDIVEECGIDYAQGYFIGKVKLK